MSRTVIRFVQNLGSQEKYSVSIERTQHVVEIQPEINRNNPEIDKYLTYWPSKGVIEFKNVSMRYRPDTKLVLQDVSFKINSNEKIGLVGRTGSGKSSIFLCIFRMVELEQGQILIDNQDIAQVGLLTLRKKLAIIPQDPVIFLGTLKYNLDPFGEYSDQKLLEVVETTGLCHLLKKKMRNCYSSQIYQQEANILDFKVQECGENLSIGERQLICIARALLKNSKILLLDEATSSIDYATDQKIQALLRERFQNTTMLIIAHRLDTLLDTNRVIRLDKGKVVEIARSKDILVQSGLI